VWEIIGLFTYKSWIGWLTDWNLMTLLATKKALSCFEMVYCTLKKLKLMRKLKLLQFGNMQNETITMVQVGETF